MHSRAQTQYSIDTIPLAPGEGASGVYQIHIAFPYIFYTSVRDTLRSEDIWITKIDKNGKVISPSELVGGITTMETEGSSFYSKKSKTLYYLRSHPKRMHPQFAMAKYNFKKNKASFIRFLSDSINASDSWNSMFFLSKNEDTLYFASNRKGGKGGTDLWYSTWNNNQKGWNKSKNLSIYNTKYNETSPFIDYETGTFYFSSDSLGSSDIYQANLKHNSRAVPVPEFSLPEYDEKYFVWYKNFGYISRKIHTDNPNIYHRHFQAYRITRKKL
ncbi:MAG: hypothetical protein NZ455_04305 [Bacteroidia bacterium]|nr:hypothetical protein [Bacteroidia bacterium]MDW8346861.1 hypothetical protein [Bacteroidia bacterium]